MCKIYASLDYIAVVAWKQHCTFIYYILRSTRHENISSKRVTVRMAILNEMCDIYFTKFHPRQVLISTQARGLMNEYDVQVIRVKGVVYDGM